jgi:TolB-like protein/DNA-binding winged helix-turn-helix (wHTH) protein/Tfp pilus assembly protein PilF
MASPAQSVSQYQFGAFTVDTRSGELRKLGIRIKLQERPFQLLVALLERPGDVVTREELRQRLWPDGTFVDFDHNLGSSINKLRSALNDSSTHPRYIETVGRRGYRFLADVKLASAGSSVEVASAVADPVQPFAPSRRWMGILAAVALLAVLVTAYLQWKTRPKPAAAASRVMLAVLPFESLTGDDSAQEYFSDGLTEEMTTQLGRMDPRRLGVIARTSVIHYKHSQKTLDQIGSELGVQYVLEGSIRRDSDNIRIAAQLIQVKDQTHVWARQYDRKLKDVLLLQSEIAREISDEIQFSFADHKAATSPAQSSLSPEAYEAYNLYLQGLYFWNKRTLEGFKEAIKLFEQATKKDPNFARAYAGLADAYTLLSAYSGTEQDEMGPKAHAAALRALEIDPNLAEAHTAFALVVEDYDWDWATAEKEFRRAIELNPNYATAHHWYAECLMWQRRFDEALRENELARQLDPLSLIIAADKGAILYYSRQYDRAIDQFRYVRNMDARFLRTALIVECYVHKGMFAEAQEAIGPADVNNPWYWSQVAYVQGRSGRHQEAHHAVDQLSRLNRRHPVDPGTFTAAYMGMGNKQQTLRWLEKAVDVHAATMTALNVEPVYDPLRDEPRFQQVLRRLGFTNNDRIASTSPEKR